MNAFITLMGNTVSSNTGTASATGGSSMVSTIVMFAAIILVFYFLIIRPQRKRDKEAKDMMANLKKGDKIVTIGGIRGTVAVVKENTVIVKVDDNTRIEFTKTAIAQVLNATAAGAAAGKKDKPAKIEETVSAPGKEEKKDAAPAEAPAPAAEDNASSEAK